MQGFKEERELLDGANFDYASNVISLTAIRQMFMRPMGEGEIIAQVDVATAFLQATPFGPDEAPRYHSSFATSVNMGSSTAVQVLLSDGRIPCTLGSASSIRTLSEESEFQGSCKARTRSPFFITLDESWWLGATWTTAASGGRKPRCSGF